MINTYGYDVEILPNFFSITFININDYLKRFYNCCIKKEKKGKIIRTPIPLVQYYSVKQIKEELNKVDSVQFYITDKNDTQLLPMVSFINNMKKQITHCFGYNSMNYDKIMVAGLLANFRICKNTKELITYLYELSKKIISTQDNRDYQQNDYELKMLRNYSLPYKDIDLMRIFALNKVGKGVDSEGNTIFFSKGLKQTSINLQWYELLEYELPLISDKDRNLYEVNPKLRSLTNEDLNKRIDKWDRLILNEWIPSMMYYNKNDVFIVCEIIRLNIDEINLRYNISSVYGVDVLNSSRSNIADRLFEKFYSEFSGLEPWQWKGKTTERTVMAFKRIILPFIQFKTKPLQDLLTEMKATAVTSLGKDSFKKEIKIGNLIYTIATGGLHSQDIPRELKSKIRYINENPPTGEDIWNNITDDSFIYVHWDMSDAVPHLKSHLTAGNS